jgi:hypothetical protein
MIERYMFRREDTDEVILVDFETMMTMDEMGCIKLEDGVYARRCRSLEPAMGRTKNGTESLNKPMVSDSLGFTESQLADFEEHRKKGGFTGIEFKRDPDVPQFFQVHCSGPEEFRRYREERNRLSGGMFQDHNSRNGGGQALSERDLRAAEQMIREKYPEEI